MNAVHSGFHYVLSQYVIDILWEFYCFSFGQKWEKQEKATDDRQRSGKYERKLRAEKVYTFFGKSIFLAKNVALSINVGRAPSPHMWLQPVMAKW